MRELPTQPHNHLRAALDQLVADYAPIGPKNLAQILRALANRLDPPTPAGDPAPKGTESTGQAKSDSVGDRQGKR